MLRMYQQTELRGQGYKDLGAFSESGFWALVAELPLFSEMERSVGVIRDEHDYIDISRDSESVYRLTTELLLPGERAWKKLFFSRRISKQLNGITSVQQVVLSYSQVGREEFELSYR